MLAMGVTPEYVRALREAGLTDLDAGEITGMVAMGVTPEYAAQMAELGVADVSPQVLAALQSRQTPATGPTRRLEQ